MHSQYKRQDFNRVLLGILVKNEIVGMLWTCHMAKGKQSTWLKKSQILLLRYSSGKEETKNWNWSSVESTELNACQYLLHAWVIYLISQTTNRHWVKCFNTVKRGQNKTNPYEGLSGFLVQNKFNHDIVKHLLYSTKYDPNVAHKPVRSKPSMPRGFAMCI